MPNEIEPKIWLEFEITERLLVSSEISDRQMVRRQTRFLNALLPPQNEILTISDQGEIINNPNEIEGLQVVTETRITGEEVVLLESFVDFERFASEGPKRINEFIATRFNDVRTDLQLRLTKRSNRRARIFQLRGDPTSALAESFSTNTSQCTFFRTPSEYLSSRPIRCSSRFSDRGKS